MIELILPTPPSINALFANAPGKGRTKTDRYKTWLNAAGWSCQAAKVAGRAEKVAGPYGLHMLVSADYKGDIDNLSKAVCDLLVKQDLTEDDQKLWTLHVERSREVGKRFVQVTVWEAQSVREPTKD